MQDTQDIKVEGEEQKQPPWLNPQTNMFSGFVPCAISLSIMACTLLTASSTLLSSI